MSPHELMQAITIKSNKKFQIGHPVLFACACGVCRRSHITHKISCDSMHLPIALYLGWA